MPPEGDARRKGRGSNVTMDLTADLLTLQGLSGDLESADMFCETYERALKKAQKKGDIEAIKALKRILDVQCLYFVSLYLRQEADLKDAEQKNEIQ